MPIEVKGSLPATKILESENIFVITEERANAQDIRPLKIVILNLMPTKIETETQLLRLLGNSPLQVDIELLQMATHVSKNTSASHLNTFYKTFPEIQDEKFDGMIITGAPIEHLEFEAVDYWEELQEIMNWSKTNVYSTMHICWGAQAGLYHHYGIPKKMLPEKLSGIFKHKILNPLHPLTRGFDDRFFAPHSRHTTVDRAEIEQHPNLMVLSVSNKAGVYISWHPKADGNFSSLATQNTTGKPWPMSTIGTWAKASIPKFRKTIFPRTKPMPCLISPGAATQTYCSPTGSIIMSISKPHSI